MLRFDGLYFSPQLDDGLLSRRCLRFFADATVMSASLLSDGYSVAQLAALVARWLTRGSRHGRGVYYIEGDLLRFTTRDDPDEAELREGGGARPVIIDYEGEISGENLNLSLYSRFNGYQIKQLYSFVAFKP